MVSESAAFSSQLRLIEPERFLRESREIKGAISVKNFTRLCTQLAQTDGEIYSVVTFARDVRKRCVISITTHTILWLNCQRCLTNFQFEVNRSFQVCPVQSEFMHSADDLPEEYEPVLLEDGVVNLWDTIEDELLLSLPLVAMHENRAECVEQGYRTTALAPNLQQIKEEQEAPNPFSVLKAPVDDKK